MIILYSLHNLGHYFNIFMEEANVGVYSKSIRSGQWFFLNIASQKFIGVISFFILARLLLPADYGAMTAVLLVIGLINQITVIPFGDALTQRKGDIESYLDPLWTFEIMRSVVCALFLFLVGDMSADFFHLSGSTASLMRFSGLLILIPAFANARQIFFFKELDFKKVFLRDVVSQIIFVVTAVAFALFFQASPWALFVGYAAQYFSGVLMGFILYPVPPKLSFHLYRLKDLLGYSKWSYGQDLMNFLSSQIDKVVVGRLLSPNELGLYAKAKDLSSTATSIVFSIFDKVGFAAFSKVQDRMEKVHEGFLKSVDVIVIGALPITMMLLLEGGAIVQIFLGTSWLPLVVPLKIFAFGNLFLVFNRVVAPVFNALGRPDINFKINILQLVVTFPTMLIGYQIMGFRGLPYAIAISWAIILVYVVFRARKILHIPVKDFVPALKSGFIACIGITALDFLFRLFDRTNLSTPVLLLQIGILGILYFVLLFSLSLREKHGPYKTLISIFREIGIVERVEHNVT